MRTLGLTFQLTGLILPPVAIGAELAGFIPIKMMLVVAFAAVTLFWLGRICEQSSGK